MSASIEFIKREKRTGKAAKDSGKTAKDIALEKELTIDLLHFLYAQRNFWKSSYYDTVKDNLEFMTQEGAFSDDYISEDELDYFELTERTKNVLCFKEKSDMRCLLSPKYKDHEVYLDFLFNLMSLSRQFNYTAFAFFLPYDIKQYCYSLLCKQENPAYMAKTTIIGEDGTSHPAFAQNNPAPTPIYDLTAFVPGASLNKTVVEFKYGFGESIASLMIDPLSCDTDILKKAMNRISTDLTIGLNRHMEGKCIEYVNSFKRTLGDDEFVKNYKGASEYLEGKTAIDDNLKLALAYKSKCDEQYSNLEMKQRDYSMLESALRDSYEQRISGLLLYDIKYGYNSLLLLDDDDEYVKHMKEEIQRVLNDKPRNTKDLWIKNAEMCIDSIAIIPITSQKRSP